MLLRPLVLLVLVPLAGSVSRSPPDPPPPAVAPAPVEPPGVWVDASAAGPGDGSRERPFKALASALEARARPLRIHLHSGMYAGPFALPDGASLEGEGQVVLYAEGPEPTVTASGEVHLSGLTIQGGATGLQAKGTLVLERVQVSGQRRTAVRLEAGSLRASGSTFQASVSDSLGLDLGAGARATLEDSAFLGPYWRGVQARGIQRISLERCRFEGPVTGLHQVGGEAIVRGTTLSGGRGPALFMARGSLRVEQVEVKGHEYGLQTRQVDPLTVRGFTSVSADRAGLGLVESRADLEDVLVIDSGSYGALQIVGGEVTARRLRLHRPEAYGVSARSARLTLSEAVITAVQDREGSAGNAVELRGTTATVEGLTVVDAAGIGVLATEGSTATLRALLLERCRWAGVAVETQADVKGVSIIVRDSPGSALAVPGEGKLAVDVLSSEHNAEGPVWAECDRGAQVRLSRLRDDGPARTFPACVTVVKGREVDVPRPAPGPKNEKGAG